MLDQSFEYRAALSAEWNADSLGVPYAQFLCSVSSLLYILCALWNARCALIDISVIRSDCTTSITLFDEERRTA
jgi:hypothetical protein